MRTTSGGSDLVPDVGRAIDFDELLTVEDVAALLQVPKSWVYERTRRRGAQRLPFIRLGKYVRFEREAIRNFVARQRSHVTVDRVGVTIDAQAKG